jgi:predicted DNA-binding transcriptional regulator AlpA
MSDDDKPPKDIILVEEVSALLGPPRMAIYRLSSSDPDFPKPFKIGKRLFWKRADILAYRDLKQKQYAERSDPSSPWRLRKEAAKARKLTEAWRASQERKPKDDE